MKTDRKASYSDSVKTVAVAMVALFMTFGWLFYVVGRGKLINSTGFLVGLYSIFAAFYVQLSPNINHKYSLKEIPPSRITITLYIIGTSTVFYAIRISKVRGQEVVWANPLAGAIANSLIVSLVTGWVVFTYLTQRSEEENPFKLSSE